MQWSIPNQLIEQARTLVNEDRIIEVIPNKDSMTWEMMVMTDRIYHVTLDGTEKEQDQCECLLFQEKGYCIHTVASELYLKQQYRSRRLTQQTQALQTSRLDHLQSLLQLKQPTALTLHPYIITDNQEYRLFLKMSRRNEKRQYIVKKLSEFCYDIEHGNEYILGKDSVQLHYSSFNDDDQRLLSLLWDSLNDITLHKGKELYLSPRLFFQVSQLLTEQSRYCINQCNEQFVQAATFPFDLRCVSDDEGLLLYRNQVMTQVTPSLWVTPTTYHVLSLHEQQMVELLDLLFLNEHRIFMTKKEAEQWWQIYYPILSDIVPIHLDDTLVSQCIHEPLSLVFQAALSNHQLMITPKFNYGKIEVNAQHGAIIKRDIVKENKALHLLEELGYHNTMQYWQKSVSSQGIVQFFQYDMVHLQEMGTVELSSQLQKKQPQPIDLSMMATENNHYLEISFDTSMITNEEVQPLIESIQRHDRFFETITGEWIELVGEDIDSLRQLTKNQAVTMKDQKTLMLKQENVMQLPQTMVLSPKLIQLQQYLSKEVTYPSSLPSQLNIRLRPYQEEGVRWLTMLYHYGLSGLLADDMGLGKTIQVIGYLSLLKETQTLSVLIIAPASVLYNWQKEIQTKASNLQSCVVFGSKDQRMRQLKQEADIYITSYASFRQDSELYQQQSFDCLILDEAQMVKNSNSKVFKALTQIDAYQWVALSGTPIENHQDELWSIFHLLLPHLFGSKTMFKSLSLQEIRKKVHPFMLRRTKEDVLPDLPTRQDEYMYSALTKEQKSLYIAYLKEMNQRIDALDDKELRKQRIPILAGLTRLRQICCSPALVNEQYSVSSGKIEQLIVMLHEAKKQGHRFLLFSQFTSMITLLEERLTKEGLTYLTLTGQTKTSERQTLCEQFNEGTADVFLISLKAGGAGLNLTGADVVILFDSWWNPAIEEQAAGRAHRLGQQKNVSVWHFIAEGTIEEKIDVLQKKKQALVHEVIDASSESLEQYITEQELRELLQYDEKESESWGN